jgi:hypothetical protein
MIYEAAISNHNGELIVKAPASFARTLVESLAGLFISGMGFFPLYIFLFGLPAQDNINIIKRILGWIVIITFTGIVIVWGLRISFARRSYRICDKDAVLLSQLRFAGVPLSTKRYPFSTFDRVAVRPESSYGAFATHLKFVVACDGTQRLDLSVFDQLADAHSFAARIAAQMHLNSAQTASWNAVIVKVSGILSPLAKVEPEDCLPLGTPKSVRAVIRSAFPSAEWMGSSYAVYFGSGFVIEIWIHRKRYEPVRLVQVRSTHDSAGDPKPLLLKLTEANGWLALDSSKLKRPGHGLTAEFGSLS